MKLTEGLRSGDLEDTVLPLISIDEYESKIDQTAVVVGFFANEMGAAEDMNRFIQRSPLHILDTDISPAPDQHGYYMIFVEILRNDKLVDTIDEIISEVSPLTSIDKWSIQVRGSRHIMPYAKKTLGHCFVILDKKDKEKEEKEKAKEKDKKKSKKD